MKLLFIPLFPLTVFIDFVLWNASYGREYGFISIKKSIIDVAGLYKDL